MIRFLFLLCLAASAVPADATPVQAEYPKAAPVAAAPAAAAPAPAAKPEARPAATADDWAKDPNAAASKATEQAKMTAAAAENSSWSSILGWAAGAAGVILALARVAAKSNPIAGAVVGLLETGWKALAPRYVQDAEKKQEQAADGLRAIVAVIEAMPNTGTVGDLKAKIATKVPSTARDVINAYVSELETKKPNAQLPIDPALVASLVTAAVEAALNARGLGRGAPPT